MAYGAPRSQPQPPPGWQTRPSDIRRQFDFDQSDHITVNLVGRVWEGLPDARRAAFPTQVLQSAFASQNAALER